MLDKIMPLILKLMLGLLAFSCIGLNILYIIDITQDNFINRHHLMGVDELSTFLHDELPVGSTSLSEVTNYAEIEGIECRPPSDYQGGTIVVCTTAVTNPAFYGSFPYPFVLIDIAYDHVFISFLFVRFYFSDSTLQDIKVEFTRGYI